MKPAFKYNYVFVLLCYCIICMFLGSCDTVKKNSVSPDQTQRTYAMGHAGMGFRNPFVSPNSIKSFKKCFKNGADGTELDVQLTKDGKLVVIHDGFLKTDSLDKEIISNLNWTGGIENIEIETGFLQKHQIQSLDHVLNVFENDTNFMLSLDCKIIHASSQNKDRYVDQFVESLVNTISTAWADRIIIESRDIDFLNKLSNHQAKFKLFYLPENFQQGYDTVLQNEFTGMNIKMKNITKENIQIAREQGIQISVYNVNTRSKNKTVLAMAPDYIQSDRVGHLVSIIDRSRQ